MFISPELLTKALAPFAITLSAEQIAQLDAYARMLVDYNEKVNLTAITDPDEIVVKHFADSLALLHFCCFLEKALVADIGTGAGFPGVVLMIARPDLKLNLFDSTKKKLLFIDSVIAGLSLNGQTVHLRAEEAGHDRRFREAFSVVTARAVAELRVLSEFCVPLVKPGGLFIAMKGDLADEELQAGKGALKTLGARIDGIESYNLPSADKRTLILSKKISQTSTKYPRAFSQISKKPL
ncbi:MAG: 16S rRNA (guanine(527)-N(7))-methyltransferase RsmG [Oscillospiraceae bacterium]|nr:16S rRNA (guanine(527)-N(7))-methyltransferase RsmG [Oscillospiraceae bacterium]